MFDFEKRKGGERTVLVNVNFTKNENSEEYAEFRMLAWSAGAQLLGELICSRKAPDPRFFIGEGKTETLADFVATHQIDLVIFNYSLSPSQERNLEAVLKCRVIDRTALILDIFASRARTTEGKIQVELAQLAYIQTRLVRGWTHLERQKGGIGLRGPGETQLETDRRLLKDRITILRNELSEVEKHRNLVSKSRAKNSIPIVSLVGYTNAGKSTLFNVMTDSNVYAADQLFATLDPTLRTVELPYLGKVIFADTVGFIKDLPTSLVAAFKATLIETQDATLLLHVIDISSEQAKQNQEVVEDILEEIGANHVPVLKVFNKIDKLEGVENHIEYDDNDVPIAVNVSAHSGKGIDMLFRAIGELLGIQMIEIMIKLPASMGALRNRLYELKSVVQEEIAQDGAIIMTIRQKEATLAQLNKKFAGALEQYCIEPKDFTFIKDEF